MPEAKSQAGKNSDTLRKWKVLEIRQNEDVCVVTVEPQQMDGEPTPGSVPGIPIQRSARQELEFSSADAAYYEVGKEYRLRLVQA